MDYSHLHPPERETLVQFLDQHRAMVLAALDGLSDEAAVARLLPATEMTIGGIVKHLAHMEDLWFTCRLLGASYPPPWEATGDDETWAWESARDDSVASLRALYRAACDRSRAATARFDDLDHRAAQPSFGKAPVSLRWMLVQMIRETAQHCGHLDLMLDVVRRAPHPR
ncbi:DinB family protein [Actinoplanes sp. LDG1-06]|uniref:DinB family protein n=1 Tax=Paractinoplanes ovalisporus TaxID=2810368 RepID=A0ABS2AQP4_9ACTN|nr:DinB family protein [Actinoplanes ovalisporus]MBM2622105.1 DinB family protein [Actinoplanes ovalisporus]